MRDQIDRQEKILARLLEWIRASDARVPPIAALNTAMLGVIAAFASNEDDWTMVLSAVVAVTLALLTVSLILLALATFPRIEGPERSVTFFEGIISRDVSTYQVDLNAMTEEGYLVELIEQSHRNAEIASAKFRYVRFAMITWFVGIAPWIYTLYALLSTNT